MRLTLFGFLLLTSAATLHAAPASIDTSTLGADGNAKPGAGFTISATTRPYSDIDDIIVAALPFFSYSSNRFYVSGLNVGYHITTPPDPFTAPEIEVGWDLLAVPRFLGYKAEESPALEGLDDTDYSIHAGVSVTLLNAPVTLNAQLLTDILGVNNGTELSGTISKSFALDKLSLTPAFGITVQDSNLVDFYYGVDESDATADRPAFEGDNVVNADVSLTAAYPITSKLLGIAAVNVEAFGSAISDSPIIDSSTVTAATFGLVYTF